MRYTSNGQTIEDKREKLSLMLAAEQWRVLAQLPPADATELADDIIEKRIDAETAITFAKRMIQYNSR